MSDGECWCVSERVPYNLHSSHRFEWRTYIRLTILGNGSELSSLPHDGLPHARWIHGLRRSSLFIWSCWCRYVRVEQVWKLSLINIMGACVLVLMGISGKQHQVTPTYPLIVRLAYREKQYVNAFYFRVNEVRFCIESHVVAGEAF